ncbi:MAG: hypothetical protein GY798_34500 [Hyphomicrobiales bacterium]|nr:hypothetical protein [Hyphomicrobiales bacterium]
MKKHLLALVTVAGVSLGATVTAVAQDDHLDEVWADAVGGQEPILTDAQFAMLNNLAFQAAVTKICDGYGLDPTGFETGVAEAMTPAPADLTDEEAEHWRSAVVMRFGTVYGILLTQGNGDAEAFCASADEMKADSEVPNVWQ